MTYQTMTFRSAAIILASFVIAACSSPTTVSEWSCPTDQPDGCFDVATGDAIALDRLKAGNIQTPTSTSTVSRMTLPKPISITSESDTYFDGDGWPIKVDDGKTTRGRQDGPFSGNREDQSMRASDIAAAFEQAEPPDTNAVTEPVREMIERISTHWKHGITSVRVPEQLAEIWIGAFEDAQGNYHPASRLFIVVRPAIWRR